MTMKNSEKMTSKFQIVIFTLDQKSEALLLLPLTVSVKNLTFLHELNRLASYSSVQSQISM